MMAWLVKQVNKKNKGFTLIEMVVVMAIIAVLIAIAVPQVLRLINKSKVTADLSSAKTIATQIQQYMADGGNLNASSSTLLESSTDVANYVKERVNGGIPTVRFNKDWKWIFKADTISEEVYVGVRATTVSDSPEYWLFPQIDPANDNNPYFKYK